MSYFETVRSLIPFIRPLSSIEDWPEAYCDVTTAQVRDKILGWDFQCGLVEDRRHIWLKRGDLNVDFTASQFPTLERYLVDVDGFYVVYGTDRYLERLGYIILPKEQCAEQLLHAGLEILYGDHGDCNPEGWSRCPLGSVFL